MLSNDDVLTITQQGLSQSYKDYDSNNPDLEIALDYYLGNPNGREVEGRSRVTSTDVADAIEWIMPQIMKSFTQNNEIVIFDPVHEGDEKQAEMESEYVYEVLMKQNNGFILLHQFIKDALMQNNGILKVYYQDDVEEKSYDYTGITSEERDIILSQENVEPIEMSEYSDIVRNELAAIQYQQMINEFGQSLQSGASTDETSTGQARPLPPPPEPSFLFDMKVKVVTKVSKIVIDPVAPEEFRVNTQHNSICLDTATFTAHVFQTRRSDLFASGITDDILDELPQAGINTNTEYRFNAQDDEFIQSDWATDDESMKLIDVAECYMRMDYNEDGIAELCKVLVAGGDTPTHVLSVEEIECMPWVSTTAILMSHKFRGLSLYDRLKEIQDQKTSLWRNMFDNLYLQNNQRYAIVDGQVNQDDMIISRPGGLVRVKRMDAIMPLVTPQLGSQSYDMMSYLDTVRAGRSGVDAEGAASPANIGDRVGSQGVERLMTAKEELVGLIIRVVAETGIKPLCVKIRDLSAKHIDSIKDFRFRGEWQKIQPTTWMDRTSTTVRVGTGSGDHSQQTQSLTQLMDIHAKLQDLPEQVLVDQTNMYSLLDRYCKFTGLNGANGLFTDPASKEGQQRFQQKQQKQQQEQQKNDQMQAQMVQSQVQLAQAELQKAQAQQVNVQLRAQSDNDKNLLQLQKQTHEAEMKSIQAELDQVKLMTDNDGRSAELEFRYDEMQTRNALELTRIEADKNKEENENFEANKESVENE